MSPPRRGEIYYVTFVPVGPVNLAGPHPAVVVRNDVGNRASRLPLSQGSHPILAWDSFLLGSALPPRNRACRDRPSFISGTSTPWTRRGWNAAWVA